MRPDPRAYDLEGPATDLVSTTSLMLINPRQYCCVLWQAFDSGSRLETLTYLLSTSKKLALPPGSTPEP